MITKPKKKTVRKSRNPKPERSIVLGDLQIVEEYPDNRVMVGWKNGSKTVYVYGKLSFHGDEYLLANKDKESYFIFKEKDVKRVYYNKDSDIFAINLKD